MKNYSTQKERIIQYLEFKGISKNKFYISTGISNGTLDKKSGLTGDSIEKFYSVYDDVNPEWLLIGKGEMLKSTESHTHTLQKDEEQVIIEPQTSIYRLKTDYFGVEKQTIPLYETSAVAGLSSIFSGQVQQVPLDHIVLPNAPKCDGAMFIRGDSMYPLLKSGDIACYKIINSFDNVVFGEKYILDICNEDDDYLTVKYVQRSDKGDEYLKLVSENKYHSDRDIQISTVRAIAIVKATIRFETLS